MASITIRDIPDEIFAGFKEVAREDRRSVNAEVIEMMDKVVQERNLKRQRLQALEEMRQISKTQPPSREEETLEILRESRKRWSE